MPQAAEDYRLDAMLFDNCKDDVKNLCDEEDDDEDEVDEIECLVRPGCLLPPSAPPGITLSSSFVSTMYGLACLGVIMPRSADQQDRPTYTGVPQSTLPSRQRSH